ncbi:MAG: diphosphate--fructose-6-phosphate 1-phosphotransferase [Dehalococcoidia bacterium]|nr:diphosphate--fructose-6-phosphate 1-phosphotransferase [Dehalococcoidia bacterium]
MSPAKNLLVMQSGGPTPVINRSLFGVCDEAAKSGAFTGVFGAQGGVEGVLSDRVFDLAAISPAAWPAIAAAPGAALGTTRKKFSDSELPRVIEFIERREITHWLIIGGNDSASTALTVGAAANNAGLDLAVLLVPKTVDNDLVGTDHSPGYGSAARFVAAATQGAGRDAEAMGPAAPITVIEVAGRDSGWLAAASVLGKREQRDAPHVVVTPETLFDPSQVLSGIESAYRRYGFAVAVIQENVRDKDSRPLTGDGTPLHVDDFGNEYHEGAGRYLTTLVTDHLKVRVRYDQPGTIQRSMAELVSSVDAREAEEVGRAAVRHALDGESNRMVSIVRVSDDPYVSETGLTPLEPVTGAHKTMPAEFLDSQGMPTGVFLDYARPLIGDPLPTFGRIA